MPCGGTARSGRFSRTPQTKIRHLNSPEACKKPSLSTSPEQAWISVHHLPSLLPAGRQYVFTALIKSARSARDERQLSLFHAWSAEGGRKHKPAQRDQRISFFPKGKSRRPLPSCPALRPRFPSLLLLPTQHTGTQDHLLSLSFCRAPLIAGVAKGPFTEPFHFALPFLYTSIIFFFCSSVVSQGCIWDYE